MQTNNQNQLTEEVLYFVTIFHLSILTHDSMKTLMALMTLMARCPHMPSKRDFPLNQHWQCQTSLTF